jgi:hypothetical protein
MIPPVGSELLLQTGFETQVFDQHPKRATAFCWRHLCFALFANLKTIAGMT